MNKAKTIAVILQIAVYAFMLLGHVPAAFQVAVLVALAIPVAIGTRSLYCGYIRTDKYTALKARERKALERRTLQTELENSNYDAQMQQILLNEDVACSGCGKILYGDNKTYARKRVVPKDQAIGFVGLRGYAKEAFVEWTGACCLPKKEADQIKQQTRQYFSCCKQPMTDWSSSTSQVMSDGTLTYWHMYKHLCADSD